MTDRDTLAIPLLRGTLASVVVILIAVFLWQVLKLAIDRKLAEPDALAEPGTELAVRQARMRTLLPIGPSSKSRLEVTIAEPRSLFAQGDVPVDLVRERVPSEADDG